MSKPETEKTDAKTDLKTEKAKPPAVFYVLDTTVTPLDPTVPGSGLRIHEQIVDGAKKTFRFEHGVPLPMSPAIAMKFLRHDTFKRTDDKGELLPFKRRPKQPEELGAGERMDLGEDQTIANLDELTNGALLARVAEMPGGEQFADKQDRAGMIAFMVESKRANRKVNSAPPDVGSDAFTPEAEAEDEAA
jgi:hypothetical protein